MSDAVLTYDLTDPSHELAELAEFLLSIPENGRATFEVLAKKLGIAPSSPSFLELLGIVSGRISKLDDFTRTVNDPAVGKRTRDQVLDALQRMAGLYHPQNLIMQWAQARANYVQERDIATLEMFSARVRVHRPMRKISEQNRKELIARIDDVISDMETAIDVPEWAKYPLLDGLKKLRLQLFHIVIFGHEIVIDHLFSLYKQAEAAESYVERSTLNIINAGNRRTTFTKVFGALLMGLGLFTVPDQTLTALERYKGWLASLIAQPAQLLPPLRLLPGPPQGPTPSVEPDEDASEDEEVTAT